MVSLWAVGEDGRPIAPLTVVRDGAGGLDLPAAAVLHAGAPLALVRAAVGHLVAAVAPARCRRRGRKMCSNALLFTRPLMLLRRTGPSSSAHKGQACRPCMLGGIDLPPSLNSRFSVGEASSACFYLFFPVGDRRKGPFSRISDCLEMDSISNSKLRVGVENGPPCVLRSFSQLSSRVQRIDHSLFPTSKATTREQR